MKKILFNLSGSIACYKAAQAISKLVQTKNTHSYDVQVVATEAALRFIGEATLEGLSHKPVFSDIYTRGRVMDHIGLARWADLSVLYPATASTLNRLAAGIADDVVGALFMAHDLSRGTYWVAPAMNAAMLEHPATQSSLQELSNWGVRVLPSPEGPHACGEEGSGRLLEPDDLVDQIGAHFARAQTRTGFARVLVTAGGTREPIDSVRCVTNSSSGRTGARVAEILVSRGHQVTLLHSAYMQAPRSVRGKPFVTYDDLARDLEIELKNQHYDWLVHAAAVSDFRVVQGDGSAPRKLPSGGVQTVRLIPTGKLIDRVRDWSINSDMRLVAFKLTDSVSTSERIAAATRLRERVGSQLLVLNDVSEVGSDGHRAWILNQQGEKLAETFTKSELAEQLALAIENTMGGST